jgi:hypothetical protein
MVIVLNLGFDRTPIQNQQKEKYERNHDFLPKYLNYDSTEY